MEATLKPGVCSAETFGTNEAPNLNQSKSVKRPARTLTLICGKIRYDWNIPNARALLASRSDAQRLNCEPLSQPLQFRTSIHGSDFGGARSDAFGPRERDQNAAAQAWSATSLREPAGDVRPELREVQEQSA